MKRQAEAKRAVRYLLGDVLSKVDGLELDALGRVERQRIDRGGGRGGVLGLLCMDARTERRTHACTHGQTDGQRNKQDKQDKSNAPQIKRIAKADTGKREDGVRSHVRGRHHQNPSFGGHMARRSFESKVLHHSQGPKQRGNRSAIHAVKEERGKKKCHASREERSRLTRPHERKEGRTGGQTSALSPPLDRGATSRSASFSQLSRSVARPRTPAPESDETEAEEEEEKSATEDPARRRPAERSPSIFSKKHCSGWDDKSNLFIPLLRPSPFSSFFSSLPGFHLWEGRKTTIGMNLSLSEKQCASGKAGAIAGAITAGALSPLYHAALK